MVVAADHLAQVGLASLLAGFPNLNLVGSVADSVEAFDYLAGSSIDLVLWDPGWEVSPDPDEFSDLLDVMMSAGIPCLVLVDDGEAASVARAAGAAGVLSRSVDSSLLAGAIAAVAAGLLVVDPALADPVMLASPRILETLEEPLTPRETEVLQLIADGLSNRAIGHRLDISEHTVKFHVTAIMAKLSAESRTKAVVRAMRLGLIYL